MNAALKPLDDRTALDAARATSLAAHARLATASKALADAADIATEARAEAADLASSGETLGTLENAARLAQATRDAEAVAAVAEREHLKALARHAEVTAAAKTADAALERAARTYLLATEVQDELDALARAESDVIARRERLLGLIAVVPGLLTDRQHYAVAYRRVFTSEFTQGVVAPPLMALKPSDTFNEQPDVARVHEAVAAWRARLNALRDGEP